MSRELHLRWRVYDPTDAQAISFSYVVQCSFKQIWRLTHDPASSMMRWFIGCEVAVQSKVTSTEDMQTLSLPDMAHYSLERGGRSMHVWFLQPKPRRNLLNNQRPVESRRTYLSIFEFGFINLGSLVIQLILRYSVFKHSVWYSTAFSSLERWSC